MDSHIQIPYAELTDDLEETRKKIAEANLKVEFQEVEINNDYYLSLMIGKPISTPRTDSQLHLLRDIDSDVQLERSSDSKLDEDKKTDDKNFLAGLKNLTEVFGKFDKKLKKVTTQVDNKSYILRIEALDDLENGIHDFTANLNEYYQHADLLDNKFLKAFEAAVKAEKECIAARIEKFIAPANEMSTKLQERLRNLDDRILKIFDEIRSNKLTTDHFLAAAALKSHEQKSKLPATKELFKNQLESLPTIFKSFYDKFVYLKDFPSQHKMLATLQNQLISFNDNYNSLNSAESINQDFAIKICRAFAIERAVLGDLVNFGNYPTDVKKLLEDTRVAFKIIFSNICLDKDLKITKEDIDKQDFYIRSEFEIFTDTTKRARDTFSKGDELLDDENINRPYKGLG